jgi:DNA-binding MarR family transcriptional regulator
MDNIGQLLIRLLKAHRSSIADKLSVLDLYPGQDGLLYYLSKKDGLTMSEMVDLLKIKHPTLFIMVNRMEMAGLIRKDKDKKDKRTSRIFLTSKGKKHAQQLYQIWQELEEQLLKDFAEQEKIMTIKMLNKLINNLNNK